MDGLDSPTRCKLDLTHAWTAKKACEIKAQMQGAVQGVKGQVSGGKFGSGAQEATLQVCLRVMKFPQLHYSCLLSVPCRSECSGGDLPDCFSLLKIKTNLWTVVLWYTEARGPGHAPGRRSYHEHSRKGRLPL